MSTSRPTSTRLIVASLLIFALSGAAGLIYQSVWSQYLGLFLGHAAYAQSLVLAIFMGGMAVGAWWISRVGDGWYDLLKAYAIVELAIGLAASVFHREFLAATGFAYHTVFPALQAGTLSTAFKWTCAVLLIFPQAVLLGMTFPLMSNAVMRRSAAGDGSILGGLYFSNSLGAAIGALVATFALVPAVGLPGAMQVGAGLSILAAVLAYWLATVSAPTGPAERSSAISADRAAGARLLLIAAFVTGASSFVYEIGWVRMLSLALGSTVHSFELMLAAFIGGLALGGASIRSRIDRIPNLLRAGGYVQLLMGMAALASLLLYDHSFQWVAWLIKALPPSDSGYSQFNLYSGFIAMAIMMPAAFFAGMTLPIFTLAELRQGGGEAAVGRIYAANTVGAIVGVFLVVHLLLPVIGLKLAMVSAATADLALGLVLLRRSMRGNADQRQPDRNYFLALAAAGLAASLTLVLARFDPLAMMAGVYRTGDPRLANDQRVIFYNDGKTASIGVSADKGDFRVIATNGKPDASIAMRPDSAPTMDELTMVMAGVLPLAMHDSPSFVANIGFGSGLTTQTFLSDPRVKSVDTIEIEPQMVEGAKLFRPIVERAYSDPRSHLHFEDARSYFTEHNSKYDIIVSEPSNPWVSGVASLFSREFYRFVPRHLRPKGLFVQWLQLYEINDELVATMMAAMAESFPDYRIYLSNYGDMIVVASADGTVPDAATARTDNDEMLALLSRHGIAAQGDLEFHQLGDRKRLSPLFRSLTRRVNSDFFPIVSLEAPRTRFKGEMANTLIGLPVADLPYLEVLSGLPAPAGKITVTRGFNRTLNWALAKARVMARHGENVSGLGQDARLELRFLRETVGTCRYPGGSGVALAALAELAGNTIPYLPSEGLRGLWIDQDWLDCKDSEPPVQEMLSLLEALSARDYPTAQRHAHRLLEIHADVLTPEVAQYVLSAGMLAAVADHDFVDVVGLARKYDTRWPAQGPAGNYRRWMLLIAQDGLASRRARPSQK